MDDIHMYISFEWLYLYANDYIQSTNALTWTLSTVAEITVQTW